MKKVLLMLLLPGLALTSCSTQQKAIKFKKAQEIADKITNYIHYERRGYEVTCKQERSNSKNSKNNLKINYLVKYSNNGDYYIKEVRKGFEDEEKVDMISETYFLYETDLKHISYQIVKNNITKEKTIDVYSYSYGHYSAPYYDETDFYNDYIYPYLDPSSSVATIGYNQTEDMKVKYYSSDDGDLTIKLKVSYKVPTEGAYTGSASLAYNKYHLVKVEQAMKNESGLKESIKLGVKYKSQDIKLPKDWKERVVDKTTIIYY